MNSKKISGRALKQEVFKLLHQNNFERGLKAILKHPARQVVNPLFSFFYNTDELIKWRAVTAMGRVAAELANKDMESARVVIRRLMWNLNDESGGIGWGSPEAMGEIMACHEGLAEEYSCILISYIAKNGNFLEHEALQRGAIWGFGRLANARPRLLNSSAHYLIPFLKGTDATKRGFAAWAAGALNPDQTKPLLKQLADDHTMIHFYLNWQMVERTVSRFAIKALEQLEHQRQSA